MSSAAVRLGLKAPAGCNFQRGAGGMLPQKIRCSEVHFDALWDT